MPKVRCPCGCLLIGHPRSVGGLARRKNGQYSPCDAYNSGSAAGNARWSTRWKYTGKCSGGRWCPFSRGSTGTYFPGGFRSTRPGANSACWRSGIHTIPCSAEKEGGAVALGGVWNRDCRRCHRGSGNPWEHAGAFASVIRIAGAGGFIGTIFLSGTGGFPQRNLYQRGRGLLFPVSQWLETCRPGGYGQIRGSGGNRIHPCFAC